MYFSVLQLIELITILFRNQNVFTTIVTQLQGNCLVSGFIILILLTCYHRFHLIEVMRIWLSINTVGYLAYFLYSHHLLT